MLIFSSLHAEPSAVLCRSPKESDKWCGGWCEDGHTCDGDKSTGKTAILCLLVCQSVGQSVGQSIGLSISQSVPPLSHYVKTCLDYTSCC